jgi:ZIP family zinc transporter
VLEAFLWGLLAASSLVLGALVVDIRMPGKVTLGLVMGFGAGVLLSAVSFELVEEAVEVSEGQWAPAAGFFLGAVAFFLGDEGICRMGYRDRKSIAGTASDASGLAIVLGIVLDGIPESAVIGLTVLETGSVGVGVLVAVFISNLPEAVAATSSLHTSGWSRGRVLQLWVAIAVVSGLAALAGYGLLDGASGEALGFVNAFAGGAILAMLSSTMVPEAYEHAGRAVGLATTFGFAVGYAVSTLSA